MTIGISMLGSQVGVSVCRCVGVSFVCVLLLCPFGVSFWCVLLVCPFGVSFGVPFWCVFLVCPFGVSFWCVLLVCPLGICLLELRPGSRKRLQTPNDQRSGVD